MSIERVEDEQKRETPADTVDDGLFAGRVELVNEVSQKEKMDERPNVGCPRSPGD